MKRSNSRISLALTLLILCSTPVSAQDSDSVKIFSCSGYLKDLPYLSLIRNGTASFDNLATFRLNVSARISSSTQLRLELRNRVMAGQTQWGLLAGEPSFRKGNNWLDLSVAEKFGNDHGLIHLMADRFYLEHSSDKWQFRAGRQRINWGINMVSNPNDLFNTYSFFDFDYPERPGADAVRVQYFASGMSRLEAAFAPADHISESIGALLYALNYKGYDLQFIAGYYRNRLTLGSGWAGHLGPAGFKGEISCFGSNDKVSKNHLVASVSADYITKKGLYLVLEGLYNGGYQSPVEEGAALLQSLSADNIMISMYAVTASASYAISPIINGSMAVMMLPDTDAWFVSPSLVWSVTSTADISLISQLYASNSGDASILAATIAASLQWSF